MGSVGQAIRNNNIWHFCCSNTCFPARLQTVFFLEILIIHFNPCVFATCNNLRNHQHGSSVMSVRVHLNLQLSLTQTACVERQLFPSPSECYALMEHPRSCWEGASTRAQYLHTIDIRFKMSVFSATEDVELPERFFSGGTISFAEKCVFQ